MICKRPSCRSSPTGAAPCQATLGVLTLTAPLVPRVQAVGLAETLEALGHSLWVPTLSVNFQRMSPEELFASILYLCGAGTEESLGPKSIG